MDKAKEAATAAFSSGYALAAAWEADAPVTQLAAVAQLAAAAADWPRLADVRARDRPAPRRLS